MSEHKTKKPDIDAITQDFKANLQLRSLLKSIYRSGALGDRRSLQADMETIQKLLDNK